MLAARFAPVGTQSTRDILLTQMFHEAKSSNSLRVDSGSVSVKLLDRLRVNQLFEELELEYLDKV